MCGHPRFKEERGASAWCTLIHKKNSPFQRSNQLIFQMQNKQHAMCLCETILSRVIYVRKGVTVSQRMSDPEGWKNEIMELVELY